MSFSTGCNSCSTIEHSEKGIVVVLVAQGDDGDEGILLSVKIITTAVCKLLDWVMLDRHHLQPENVASVDDDIKWARYFNVQYNASSSGRKIEKLQPSNMLRKFHHMNYNISFSTEMNTTLFHDESHGTESFIEVKNLYACHKIHQNLCWFILLVKRGRCFPGKKIVNAQNAGAAGVFVYNENETQNFPYTSKITIPSQCNFLSERAKAKEIIKERK